MRMLMNNLDPEVAEHPDQLVVYGGSGRAAAAGTPSTPSSRSLRDLGDDETLLVQSGKPVGVVPHPRVGAAGADRQLQPRPQWANWDEFRRLEAPG